MKNLTIVLVIIIIILVAVVAFQFGSSMVEIPSNTEVNTNEQSNSIVTPENVPADKIVSEPKPVFLQPVGGSQFTIGGKMLIKWDPSVIDVSTIWLVPINISPDKDGFTPSRIQVYKRDDLNDAVTKNGEFTLEINKYSYEKGSYRVQLATWGEQRTEMSDIIFLVGPFDSEI